MKEVGKLERTSIKHIKDWRFRGCIAGFFQRDASFILAKHQIVHCYRVRDAEKGWYSFNPRTLIDIMEDPQTKKLWAVFIDDVFDEHSDVLRIEVTD